MSIKASLTAAMKDAMRARDQERLNAIRLILADVKRIEVDERIEVEDDRMLIILDKMKKQRYDSISQFEKAGRGDLVEREQYELGVIADFLPEQLSDEELDAVIKDAIEQTGASSMRDMGKVVALVKSQAQGRADMGQVSQRIKGALA